MPVIEATNLEKTYPDGTHALRGVSLTVEKGEFVAIMGPSGSGKSTLLHLLGLLDFPTAGKLIINDKDASKYSKEQLAHIRNEDMGFVFQTFNLLPRTTALENVKLPLLYSDIKESEWNERAERSLTAVGLSHRKKFEPAKLSGGERQRVAIARALITDPPLIFADEPTGNLDSKAGEVIISILEKLHEEGRTIVLITHELYLAEHAKRIITIKDGHIESDKQIKNRIKAKIT